MKNIAYLILISFFVLFLFNINQKQDPTETKIVSVRDMKVKVDLALTLEEQGQGLSGRESLKEDEGMLFVFEKPGQYSFWMKDMNFPIDIIWIGENLKVVYIKENVLPESYPETYGPDRDAKYVLEVISGFSEKNNLKIGDRVEFAF